MLLVNGFKPIQTNYNNQNSNKTNFSQPQLRTKADSVSFGARFSPARQAEKMVEDLTQGVLKEYSDVLGVNFKTKFLEPVNAFLAKHDLLISHENMPSVRIRTQRASLNEGEVENASEAFIISSNGSKLKDYTGRDGYVISVTQNGAKARIFRDLINGQLVGPKMDFPEELLLASERVNKALDEVWNIWIDSTTYSNDLKAVNYQKACNKLMPQD